MARFKTAKDTNAANSLELDLACFDKAWKCSPDGREKSSFIELQGNLRFLNKHRRLTKPHLLLRMVLTRYFIIDCIKAHKFDTAAESLATWAPCAPDEVFDDDYPKFRVLLKACRDSEKQGDAFDCDISELVRNVLAAFYCNSFSDLFALPSDGKKGLPSDFSVMLLDHYSKAMEFVTQDCSMLSW